jgi:hypothetical protein
MQLDAFQFTRLRIDYIEGENKAKKINIRIGMEPATCQENLLLFRLRLLVKLWPDKGLSGYKVDTIIEGFFKFPESFSDEERNYLIAVNGGTILYGILRGQLSMISGSFPQGKFVLPTVYMDEVVKNIHMNQNKIVEKAEKAIPPVE